MSASALFDLSPNQLVDWCAEQGVQPFRAGQIRRWLLGRRAESFAEMTDIPVVLREKLHESFVPLALQIAAHQRSSDGTEKLLLTLSDGNTAECVLMRESDRRTACISTQVGCGMGCVFCASGLLGLQRNLTTGEIIEQVLRLDRLLPDDERLTNLVVMGIGEPLANLDNLLPALGAVQEQGGMGLGARRITISTVGLPEKIRELAAAGKSWNLAVSLHAPNDRLRNELVPVNDRIGIQAILEAADDYFGKTGRRVTYEYVLLGGLNDAPVHARQLATLLAPRFAHVNLIPMNRVAELPFKRPSTERLHRFVEILKEAGVPVTVRKRKGADIDAACGQLRLQRERTAI